VLNLSLESHGQVGPMFQGDQLCDLWLRPIMIHSQGGYPSGTVSQAQGQWYLGSPRHYLLVRRQRTPIPLPLGTDRCFSARQGPQKFGCLDPWWIGFSKNVCHDASHSAKRLFHPLTKSVGRGDLHDCWSPLCHRDMTPERNQLKRKGVLQITVSGIWSTLSWLRCFWTPGEAEQHSQSTW
jgi:hypothetical protein